ncbi:ATP-binding protein [Trinickia mobilis]|uniref:ATP-binding protein n=1 Tax=Trinickia mobilis TaxID=2816356 RepID=UPI001A8E8A8E|nr:ATP-binding protein [Trinickia mobilis]
MTLFVGGVHAVGKTFVLKQACEGLGVRHATASQLIKEQRGLANWTASRQVSDVDENQRALVTAVRRLEEGGETLVLDGHFVLRRGVNIHEKIGMETFAQLMVRGVILMEAPSATIADRLLQRGDTTWEQSEIDAFAQKELLHAQTVCTVLSLPLMRLCLPSEFEVRDALAKLGA